MNVLYHGLMNGPIVVRVEDPDYPDQYDEATYHFIGYVDIQVPVDGFKNHIKQYACKWYCNTESFA